VAVIEVLVKPGDTVKAEQSLITVESDKASMEIPSSHAGVVKELKVKVGDKVKEGIRAADARRRRGAAALRPPQPRKKLLPPRRTGGQRGPAAPAAARRQLLRWADLECDMLVLGAGPGGYSAAFRAADLGMKVVWSSATPRWAASASTSAASRPRRCCTWPP
jgi:dihydrolipoamide dehydrogenase